MAKPFYADYINHMLRFYARNVQLGCPMNIKFRSEIDKQNWDLVDRVLHNLPKRDRDIIIEVFNRGDIIADNIYELSKELAVNQDVIWTLVSKITYKIAKERNLI